MASSTFSGPVVSTAGFSSPTSMTAASTTAPAAAGNAALLFSSTAALGLYFGAGSPSTVLTAAKGSLYLNTTGSSASTRAFINTDGATAWTAVTTAT